MLINQIETSQGVGVAGVNVTDRFSIQIVIGSGTAHSGIKLASDGVLFVINQAGGFSAQSGEWLITGNASDFYVQRTVLEGTLETDPGNGFLQLNTDRLYENLQSVDGAKTTKIKLEFSSDVSGVPIVASVVHTYISERAASI